MGPSGPSELVTNIMIKELEGPLSPKMGDENKTREPGWCHVLPMVAVEGTKEGSTRPCNNMANIDYDSNLLA